MNEGALNVTYQQPTQLYGLSPQNSMQSVMKWLPLMYVGAVAFEGLGLIFGGIWFLQWASNPWVAARFGRLATAGGLAVLGGIIDLGLAGLLFLIFKFGIPDPEAMLNDSRSLFVVLLAGALIFFSGIEMLVLRSYVAGVGLVIAAVLLLTSYFIWSWKLIRGTQEPMITGIIVVIGGIFLAIGGFAANAVIAALHMGVASIAVMIIGIAYFMRLYVTPQTSQKTTRTLLMFSKLVITVALIVGGGVAIWSATGTFGWGGFATATAVMDVLSGILALIAGIIALILTLTELGKELSAVGQPPPPPPPPEAPAPGTPPPPPG